jgi:ribosome-associated protein
MMTEEEYHQEDTEQGPSKSQIKRELLELQKLGERLLEMTPAQRAPFPLSPEMQAALEEGDRIKSHNARRRHVRRLGKLLRDENLEGIQAQMERIDQRHLLEQRRFHASERWRARLIEEGDTALEDLFALLPDLDRQLLRQLQRAAQKEARAGKPPTASRKLFRFLRELDLE